MPRLLQQLMSAPIDPFQRDPRDGGRPAFSDDEVALGFECAAPALQFDTWEPAPLPTTPTPAY